MRMNTDRKHVEWKEWNRPLAGVSQASRLCHIATLICVHLCSSVASFSATHALAASQDEQFIAGLNERRLFSLSEAHCRQRLADQSLDDQQRVDLTIALCRTYAEHALHTPRDGRAELWDAAAKTVDDFRRASPKNPRLVLVEMQLALTTLARGELARQEAEVGAPGAPSLDEARRELQSAVDQLEGVGEEVELLLRTVGRDPSAAALSETELLSLQRNVQFQSARALRNQGLCYPADSAERSDALIQAMDKLQPLTGVDPPDKLVWDARMDEVTCLRLRGKLAEAMQRLDAIDAARPPVKSRLVAKAERVRILLAAKQHEKALEILRGGREIAGQTAAEFDLAHVEAFIAFWKLASESKDEKGAQEWQKRAADMVQAMEQLYGPYWTRRGEMLLAASATGGGQSIANLGVLVTAAANHYRRKEYDEAVGAYERAARAAMEANDRSRAFDLYHAAALIERRRARKSEAIARQRTLGMLLREQPKASLVHLQACLDAAQLARDGSGESLDHYIALLNEHIATWPSEATANKARLWLGRLRRHQHDSAAALEAYRGVSAADELSYSEAIDGAAHCYENLLSNLRDAGEPVAGPADRAARYFEGILLGGDTRLPERFAPVDRRAALHAARLRLQFTDDGFATARTLLEAALRDAGEADADWRSQAHALLVVAQAGAGNHEAARDTLKQLAGGSPAGQLEMLRGLSDVAAGAGPAVQSELAKLQLDVVARLRDGAAALSEADRIALELAEARALAAAGQRREALAAYAQLSKGHPDDAEIQQAYAELLLAADDRESLLLALGAWRNVLRRARPNTPLWYEAKYATALSHFKLGEREQAAEMIKLLATVQPEMGGVEMKGKFLELLARCR